MKTRTLQNNMPKRVWNSLTMFWHATIYGHKFRLLHPIVEDDHITADIEVTLPDGTRILLKNWHPTTFPPIPSL